MDGRRQFHARDLSERFETLGKICEFLQCQQGDRPAYEPGDEEEGASGAE